MRTLDDVEAIHQMYTSDQLISAIGEIRDLLAKNQLYVVIEKGRLQYSLKQVSSRHFSLRITHNGYLSLKVIPIGGTAGGEIEKLIAYILDNVAVQLKLEGNGYSQIARFSGNEVEFCDPLTPGMYTMEVK